MNTTFKTIALALCTSIAVTHCAPARALTLDWEYITKAGISLTAIVSAALWSFWYFKTETRQPVPPVRQSPEATAGSIVEGAEQKKPVIQHTTEEKKQKQEENNEANELVNSIQLQVNVEKFNKELHQKLQKLSAEVCRIVQEAKPGYNKSALSVIAKFIKDNKIEVGYFMMTLRSLKTEQSTSVINFINFLDNKSILTSLIH